MRVETNEALAERSKKWAGRFFFGTLLVIIASFVLLNSPFLFSDIDPNSALLVSLVLPAVLLPLAFIATLFSIRMTNQWVRQPRPERLLVDNLKGLGKSAVLYNYYHFPARHVLIMPTGVLAMTTRYQQGNFIVKGDKWQARRSPLARLLSVMRMDGVGNPSLDAKLAAEHVDKLLSDINPDVPVYPVVLFIDPRVEFDASESSVPVLHISTKRAPNLKDFTKSLPKAEAVLTPDQIRQFEEKTIAGK